MSNKWISTKEAGEIIGISERAVRGRLERGSLAGRKVETSRGNVWEVSRESAENTVRSPAGRKSNTL
jgi:hypothetical protein